MAKQVLLLLAILLLCLAEVSSDLDTSHTSQVTIRSAARRILQETVVTAFQDTTGCEGGESCVPTDVLVAPVPAPQIGHPGLDCGGLCKHRCSLHSRPRLCARACGTCCLRCKCVPPGTFGNREACGKCYTDMTTHGNKTKCP